MQYWCSVALWAFTNYNISSFKRKYTKTSSRVGEKTLQKVFFVVSSNSLTRYSFDLICVSCGWHCRECALKFSLLKLTHLLGLYSCAYYWWTIILVVTNLPTCIEPLLDGLFYLLIIFCCEEDARPMAIPPPLGPSRVPCISSPSVLAVGRECTPPLACDFICSAEEGWSGMILLRFPIHFKL